MTEPRYERVRRIATGGMGEVWQAHDSTLHRDVALKILKPEYAADAGFRERFSAEARNAASLRHPGIATVYDFGELEEQDGSNRPFLVMELVDGVPLNDLLQPGQPMPADVARDLVAQTADALAEAHRTGIVHRDVKPANILVTPDREVKVTDFGIARAAGAVALTATGQTIGTPQYFSPEQAEGKPTTPASDVYALGVVLFECLAGRRPFTGDTPVAVAIAHLREPAPPLPDSVPADLRAITARALAKDPAQRYASAAELATALRGGPGATAPPPQTATQVVPSPVPSPDATQVLGAPVPDGPPPTIAPTPASYSEEPDDDKSKGGLSAWWLVAALLLIVAVVVVFLVLQNQGDDNPSNPVDESPSTTPSPTQSDTSSPEPSTVSIDESDYVGRPVEDVRSDLSSQGLRSRVRTRDNDGSEDAGTVAGVSPTGDVEEGTTIELTVWGDVPEEPSSPPESQTPSQTPSDSGSASPQGGPKAPGHGDKHHKHGHKGLTQ